MNPTFWQDKRVFITGHTGFKGSWLSIWLHNMGAQVHGYALPPITDPSLFELARVGEQVQSTLGDIRHQEDLASSVSEAQPDIVFHLAAQPLVRESYSDPLGTFDTNVMGTARLLECVRNTPGVKAVVVVTSDKCYLNNEGGSAYNEQDSLGGHDPYSASKACTELVAQCWQQSFFHNSANSGDNNTTSACSIATARAGNTIGGGDWSSDRLIPDVLQSLNQGQPVVLRNPDAVRPWQHVLEPLAGYLLLAEKLYTQGQPWAQAWNFGPDNSDAHSVKWITETLIAASGKGSWIHEDTQGPHEARMLKLDSTKARDVLGWRNIWSIDECIKEIAYWNEQWQRGECISEVTRSTIDRYVSSMD